MNAYEKLILNENVETITRYVYEPSVMRVVIIQSPVKRFLNTEPTIIEDTSCIITTPIDWFIPASREGERFEYEISDIPTLSKLNKLVKNCDKHKSTTKLYWASITINRKG